MNSFKQSCTKIFLVIFFSVFCLFQSAMSKGRMVIDKIVVRVNGVNMLLSDIRQPQLSKEGASFTLDEAIIDELLYQKAAEMQMLPTKADVERHLVSLKIQNNLVDMSDEAFEKELKSSGFTLETYKYQLARHIATANVRRAEMSEKIVVTTQAVKDYHQKHPIHMFHLKVATINKDQLDQRDALIKEGKVDWKDIGKINKEDIGKNFHCVFNLKKGAVSKPILADDGSCQLVMLVDKREKTFDERYGEIEKRLQQEQRKKFFEEFEEELMKKSTIIYP